MSNLSAGQVPDNPRICNTGVENTSSDYLWIGIDTLYVTALGGSVVVNCEQYMELYPEIDREGETLGTDKLLRRGLYGYRLQVQRGDIAAHFSLESRMGVLITMGPVSLRCAGGDLVGYVRGFLDEIGFDSEDFKLRVGRLDMAIDLPMAKVPDKYDLVSNWVGRSSPDPDRGTLYKEFGRCVFRDNQYTPKIESFYIGSPKSAIQLRIYDKVSDCEHDGDLDYYRELWQHDGPVTRVEWQVRIRDGHFKSDAGGDLELEHLTRGYLAKLLNYLAWDWGRFVQPESGDVNRSRWSTPVEFWAMVLAAISAYADGQDDRAVRIHPELTVTVSLHYAKQFVGMVDGLRAKLSVLQDCEAKDVDVLMVLKYLEEMGVTPSVEKCHAKAERLRRSSTYTF